ncbi:MAG: hydroxyacid dehydrogenase [Clostridia bacterium]|nr:hydroxyacid dehydrogenase [Clostridia bacterium]
MKKKMMLCTPIGDARLAEIREYCDVTIGGELKYGKGNVDPAQFTKECEGYELVVLGDESATGDMLRTWAAAGMKFIGCAKGTPATVDSAALGELGLDLSYTPGRNAVTVAEFTIGLMLGVVRHIGCCFNDLRSGKYVGEPSENVYEVPSVKNVIWGPLDETNPAVHYGIGFELHGHTLGVAGFGAIGRKVAELARAFGMKVLAYDPFVPAETIEAEGCVSATLDEMLSGSDIVSIHLPVLPETQAVVNKDWFSKMKPTAYLINTARAAVIHQKDLVDALESGTIRGAALDVYWQEPIPANHPLLGMDRVLLTPHIAGLTTDVDGWSGELMAQDILAYLKGEPRKFLWKRK